MYLLTWNEESRTIEAGVGGVISLSEAQILGEEIEVLLTKLDGLKPHVVLNLQRVSRFGPGAEDELNSLRFVCSGRNVDMVMISNDSKGEAPCEKFKAIMAGEWEPAVMFLRAA